MKNHNVEAIANPGAAGIAPQEGMPGAMRVVYPETSPEQNFQAKVWAGGDNKIHTEYTNGQVKAVVAYLRSMDNRMTSTGTEYTTSTYQLQQWRNFDYSNPPANYDEKWQLIPLTVDKTSSDTYHFRTPRTSDVSSFTFYIDTDKFVSGTYQYKVLSFEKLEKKLHLMSIMWEESNPDYKHIEDDIAVADIFADIGYFGSSYDDSPIVYADSFTAGSGDETVQINPMSYTVPEHQGNPETTIYLSDFVICIKPD